MTQPSGSAPRNSFGKSKRAAAPTISVVVASNGDRTQVNACLASLMPQCERASAQLIVARVGSTADLVTLRNTMPGVRFVGAPASATVRELRALGMAEASGDIVALTEDTRVHDASWLETLIRFRATPEPTP